MVKRQKDDNIEEKVDPYKSYGYLTQFKMYNNEKLIQFACVN